MFEAGLEGLFVVGLTFVIPGARAQAIVATLEGFRPGEASYQTFQHGNSFALIFRTRRENGRRNREQHIPARGIGRGERDDERQTAGVADRAGIAGKLAEQ